MVLKSFLIFALLSILFMACSSEMTVEIEENFTTDNNYVIFGPISGADVTIIDTTTNHKLLQTTTTTLSEGNYFTTGRFFLNGLNNLEQDRWLQIVVNNGEDIDTNDDGIRGDTTSLEGTLYGYCQFKELDNSRVIINIFTTLSALLFQKQTLTDSLENFLNQFAKKVFYKSINGDNIVDYRDLLAYIPNTTPKSYFNNPELYVKLQESGIFRTILEGKSVESLLFSDEDGDKLLWIDEVLYGTDPLDEDSNHDGIDDFTSYTLGLDPFCNDSDKDGLLDSKELQLYHTNPLKSDSDDDFFPDAYEVYNNKDPLNADEDNNGVADGLDGDPFFNYQWYLKSEVNKTIVNTVGVSTIAGNDLNILPLYHHYIGAQKTKKIIVQVVDVGVVSNHEDIELSKEYSFNAFNHTDDPSPTQKVDGSFESPIEIGHGSAVAGIIAAKTNNGFGIRGVVPKALIAGSNWLEEQSLEELRNVWVKIGGEDVIVSNNSWGTYFFDDKGYESLLEEASKLREGKGKIFVFASGNYREDFGNSNLSYLTNNRFAITVSALNHLDKYASYSNPGSNLLVSAYGGEHYYTGPTIMTTLMMGESFYANEIPDGQKGSVTVDDDLQRNYTYAMNGTSAAAPMVSGIIALVMQGCPDLGYRDVRWIIAHTAKKIDEANSYWEQNSAGLWHSVDYGFGKINPLGMLQMCQERDYENLPEEKSIVKDFKVSSKYIPDTNTTISIPFEIDENIVLEWIGVRVNIEHQYAGDLEISLVSPAHTHSVLIFPNDIQYNAYKDGFRFSSVAFMGEQSRGLWHLEITDRLAGDAGYLNHVNIEMRGFSENNSID